MGLLSRRVIHARERKDWTQGQLATYAKIEQSYLSMIEGGKRDNPGVDKLRSIATALDTTIDYLVGLTDDPRPLPAIQSPESRALTDQLGSLLAEPDMEALFRILVGMDSHKRVYLYSYAVFLSQHDPLSNPD